MHLACKHELAHKFRGTFFNGYLGDVRGSARRPTRPGVMCAPLGPKPGLGVGKRSHRGSKRLSYLWSSLASLLSSSLSFSLLALSSRLFSGASLLASLLASLSSSPPSSRLSGTCAMSLPFPGRPQPAHMRHEQRASVDALGGQSARRVKIDMVVERCRRSKARQERTFCCSEAVRTVIFTQRRRPRAYATNGHSATDISGEVWAERTSGPSRWSLVHHGWTPSRR